MRLTRYFALTALASSLLVPLPAPAAASKEMQDLQRDVAQVEQQVQDLQKSIDGKMAGLQQQIQSALDKNAATSSSQNAALLQSLQTELKGFRSELSTVGGLSVKVDNLANDVSDLRSNMQALADNQRKQQGMLNDILNQVKLIQAPPVAPSPTDTASNGAPVAGPPPAPRTLFEAAVADMNANRNDLALQEFASFLKLYPNDPSVCNVQYNMGNIHYGQGRADLAKDEFNSTIECSSDTAVLPSAYYMKGMALKKLNQSRDAIASFREVAAKFPSSDEAPKAKAQLTAMGATVSAAPATKSKPRR